MLPLSCADDGRAKLLLSRVYDGRAKLLLSRCVAQLYASSTPHRLATVATFRLATVATSGSAGASPSQLLAEDTAVGERPISTLVADRRQLRCTELLALAIDAVHGSVEYARCH